MTSQETSARLQFLWSASHTVLSAAPSLSAFYLSRFDQLAVEKNLKLAAATKRVYCSYCGSIFVPGINSWIDVKKNKRTRSKPRKIDANSDAATSASGSVVTSDNRDLTSVKGKASTHSTDSDTTRRIHYATLNNNTRHKNYVSYFCKTCKTETRFNGSPRQDPKQSNEKDPDKQQRAEKSASVNDKASTHMQRKNDHGTRIKRKRQKLDLQRLLAKDEKKGRDGGKGSPLSLTDFLSSL
jgi:RNase P subunit RPR2